MTTPASCLRAPSIPAFGARQRANSSSVRVQGMQRLHDCEAALLTPALQLRICRTHLKRGEGLGRGGGRAGRVD